VKILVNGVAAIHPRIITKIGNRIRLYALKRKGIVKIGSAHMEIH
jgi:hypothetical protein